MAPREATGSFPDQFLTFDYDVSAVVGVPPPHDPLPVAATGNDGAGGTPGTAPEGANASAGGALNHVESSTHSSGAQLRPAPGDSSHVDPLSIDPTLHQSLSWSANMDRTGNTVRGFSSLSIDNMDLHHPQPIHRMVSAGGSPTAVTTVSFPFHSPSVESSMANQLNGSTSPPLSTGSAELKTSTTPNSPLSLRFSESPIPTGTNLAAFSQRLRAGTLGSVLDNTTSIESDDEEDENTPNLERTFDSCTESLPDMDVDDGSPHVVDDDDSGGSDSCSQQGSNGSSTGSSDGAIGRNEAFDMGSGGSDAPSSPLQVNTRVSSPTSPSSILLSFGPNTTVSDLKYFAERGCIVALLQALTTPRLVTLGTRMLADYAKMPHRRVAVAQNRRILEFVQRTMMQISEEPDWLGREYAVETVRSLTATEESDRFLMSTPGLLNTLALVARGGPFVTHVQGNGVRTTMPLASEKARLHACIAVMNLSCGKANKIEIAKIPDVLESMRDIMANTNDEARLKATTCIKNLSNADANDAALLSTPGLVEALGHVAQVTCTPESGATACTTNACLALMNLSIAKANKHRVFRTPGVMDALMIVLERTTAQGSSNEARIKACSALSNLAIGYDNKIPMFAYPGFVDAILNVIQTDTGEARTKACSILWSFAAEMKNQIPVVQRGDILPVLVQVAEEDGTTEARFKCVAALTLLAESLENAIPLLESGALAPLMDILHEAGPDPTQWKGQTASWCVGFLMNIAQSDEAVPTLREAGVVELLAPLLTLDHYQSLKAAMAVTFVCRYDQGDETYDLLRKTENVIPKIISLLHNTLSGRGGNGYKYGVFTLRSSVGCIASLASGPDYMKERVATGPVYESLLRVTADFCVDGGTPGAIVGGGRDDTLSATLAVRALQSLTEHLIPIIGSSALPFSQSLEERLLIALESFAACNHPEIRDETRALATDAKERIRGGQRASRARPGLCTMVDGDADMGDMESLASHCCGFDSFPLIGGDFLYALTLPQHGEKGSSVVPSSPSITDSEHADESAEQRPVRTFLLADSRTGRRYAVPTDPSGGRSFNDRRVWCYRRGRFCLPGEEPDPTFEWNEELQQAYEAATAGQGESITSFGPVMIVGMGLQ